MTAMQVALFVAFGLFLVLWQRGVEREGLRRCHACGCRRGERHHRDCQYKGRGDG